MDWLVCGNIYTHKTITEGRKSHSGGNLIHNYVAIWWSELQKKRRNQNTDPLLTQTEMKNLLKQKFLLVNYSRDLRTSFQDLKQGFRTVIDYFEELMTMQARCVLNEADDVLVNRYFHRLIKDIQHVLAFNNFDNADKIIQHAIKVEDIVDYQSWILIQVVVLRKNYSPSLKVRIRSHVFIVINRGIDHLNVQNVQTSLTVKVM